MLFQNAPVEFFGRYQRFRAGRTDRNIAIGHGPFFREPYRDSTLRAGELERVGWFAGFRSHAATNIPFKTSLTIFIRWAYV